MQKISKGLALFQPDIVQLPLNLADQRFSQTDTYDPSSLGIEIHARSIFLQGLPNGPVAIAWFLHAGKGSIRRNRADDSRKRKTQSLCWIFSNLPEVDFAVVGVTRATELAEIVSAFEDGDSNAIDYSELAIADERYLLPMNWPARKD